MKSSRSVSESKCKENSGFEIIARVKAVLADRRLNLSERTVLAHLMFAAGECGETTWKHETLGETLGISDRQSKRITANLHHLGYLRSIQRGLRKANRYLMPWHPEFASEGTLTVFSEVTPMSLPEPTEVTPVSLQEVPSTSLPIGKDSYVKDNTNERTFGAHLLSEIREALQESCRSGQVFSYEDPMPVALCSTAAEIGHKPEDVLAWMLHELQTNRAIRGPGYFAYHIRGKLPAYVSMQNQRVREPQEQVWKPDWEIPTEEQRADQQAQAGQSERLQAIRKNLLTHFTKAAWFEAECKFALDTTEAREEMLREWEALVEPQRPKGPEWITQPFSKSFGMFSAGEGAAA